MLTTNNLWTRCERSLDRAKHSLNNRGCSSIDRSVNSPEANRYLRNETSTREVASDMQPSVWRTRNDTRGTGGLHSLQLFGWGIAVRDSSVPSFWNRPMLCTLSTIFSSIKPTLLEKVKEAIHLQGLTVAEKHRAMTALNHAMTMSHPSRARSAMACAT